MLKRITFYDNCENYCHGIVNINKSLVTIDALDDTDNKMGNIQLMVGDRIFLDSISCEREYSRLGIGTALIDMFEYLYRDYTGIVYGIYAPFNIALNVVENDVIGKEFYKKNGYQIVSRRDFIDNPELYPGLMIDDFIEAKRIFNYSLIYKQSIQKDEYRFTEKCGQIVENVDYKKLVKKREI